MLRIMRNDAMFARQPLRSSIISEGTIIGADNIICPQANIMKKRSCLLDKSVFYGAGDEARTRYLHLGKVALYRMSYTRNGHDIY